MNQMHAGALIAASLFLVLGACKPSPDCYSSAECGEDQMCAAGNCVAADAGVQGVLEPSWHEVIFPIIQQRCWGGGACHVRPLQPGIPMALEQFVDTQQPSRQGNLVFEEMAQRVTNLSLPMPPRGQSQLDSVQIRFFTRWAELGAPIGDPNKAPDAGVNNGSLDAGVTNSGPLALAGPVTEVSTGYFDLNGPAWGNLDNTLVMTDRARDAIFFSRPPAPAEILLQPSSEAVGLGADAAGSLVMTQYASRQVARVQGITVTPLSQDYMGSRYNSPHDIVGRADGNIYFTDPPFGLGIRPRELTYNGIFRLPPDGSGAVVEWQGASETGPAGIEFSPDESTLYVTDRPGGLIRKFAVGLDGSLSQESFFSATYSAPDGIVVDSQGNVYVATELGVQAFSPQAVEYGVLVLPEPATGLTFGGADLRTLYVTTRTTLYSISMPTPGVSR